MAMKIGTAAFKERVSEGIDNEFMRGAVSGAQERLRTRRLQAAEELGNWEDWRSHAEEIRQHVLDNLDFYLEQLAENVAKRGGHVFFAETAEEASSYIRDVIRQKNAKKIVKSKSMVTEEINMNEVLEEEGCEVTETDLGEYILQIDDHDPPSHIVAPALHKNKEQIRDVFKERLGYKQTEKPEELVMHARSVLRKKFLEADVGITGCNFAIADTGSVSLVTNEGNGRLVSALPKTQITVMGMERIVPSFSEFEVLVSMLTRSAVGQRLTSYITALTGPRREGEADGPEEFHLVVVDNGRSRILGTEFQSVFAMYQLAPPALMSVPYTGMSADIRTGPSIRARSAPSYRRFSADTTSIRSFRTHPPYARPVRKRAPLKFRCTSSCSSTGRTSWKKRAKRRSAKNWP